MQIKFKKLHQAAKIPTKAHPSDAGFDLTAVSVEAHDDIFTYGTGIAVEIPEGHVGLLFPRSSIADYSTLTLTNSVGVIDSGYRGEIKAKFRINYNVRTRYYEIGERIAQLIILPIPDITFVEAEELSDSDRGTGGYGSSGV